MSQTYFSFGAEAAKSRCKRSGAPLERGLVGDRRPARAAAQLAFDPVLAHHARDVVATSLDAAPAQLLPGLAGAVGAPVAAAGDLDLGQQLKVGELAAGRLAPGAPTAATPPHKCQVACDVRDRTLRIEVETDRRLTQLIGVTSSVSTSLK